jgi:mannobiose 2-epimerase
VLGNVIPFWAQHSIDRDHGGFLTYLEPDGRVFATEKHSAMQARVVYAFSVAQWLDPRPEHLALADHGARFLRNHLWDKKHGGWYTTVGRDGEVREADKPIISQAYALIGLLAHHRASGDPESLGLAEETLRLLEEHAWDPTYGGYYERCRRDWTVESNRKTASVHNDMVAAMMLASSTLGDRRYRERLAELAGVLAQGLSIERPPRIFGFARRDWAYSPSPTGDVIDVGQGLKATAMLAEASRHTGRDGDLAHAERLLEFYLGAAWDSRHGGFLTWLFRGGRVASDEKLWWTQCEGIVSLAALSALTGNEDYRTYLDRLTDFCIAHFIDEAGEWYTSCAPDGRVRDARKGNTWKGPYHSARAGFYGWSYLSGAEVGPATSHPDPAAPSPARERPG